MWLCIPKESDSFFPPKRMKASSLANTLNDDLKEKKDRRQSMADLKRRRRSTVLPTFQPSPGTAVNTVEVPSTAIPPSASSLLTASTISPEEQSKNYEQWMKIAADNVCNQGMKPGNFTVTLIESILTCCIIIIWWLYIIIIYDNIITC